MITVKRMQRLTTDFLRVPQIVNSTSPNYIPALQMDVKKVLDIKRNPFWKNSICEFVVVYKDSQPVGRAIVHQCGTHQELYKDDCFYFGFVDVVEEEEIFQALMDDLVNWAVKNGARKLLGPLNPSLNYELGVLVSGFEKDPCFMMTWNQPYYEQFYMKYGFVEAMDFYAYSVPNVISREKIDRVADLLKKRKNAAIQEIDFSNFNKEAVDLCHIYNDAFSGHYGFVPFTEEEFLYVAKDMKLIMDRRLIFKVIVNNESAGFILALPDINEVVKKLRNGKMGLIGLIRFLILKRRIKRVNVLLTAIRKKYQHLGLGSLLYAELADRVREAGYLGGELSWVASDNKKMNEVIHEMGGRIEKKYRLYEITIGEGRS